MGAKARARVKDWIGGFLQAHRAHFDPHDWPASDRAEEYAEFVRGWVDAFKDARVTEAEALLASRRLVGSPPHYRREHIPAVLGAVRRLREEKGDAAGDREAARAASRGCPRCDGEGMTAVFGPGPGGPAVSAHCVCPLGRWIRRAHARDPELARRVVDLAAVLDGITDWRAGPAAVEVRP